MNELEKICRKYSLGLRLTDAEVFLLRRALEDYKNRELEREKEALLLRLRKLEKRYSHA